MLENSHHFLSQQHGGKIKGFSVIRTDKPSENYVYKHHKFIFMMMTFLGIFPMSFDEKGIIGIRRWSFKNIYSVTLMALLCSISIYGLLFKVPEILETAVIFDHGFILCGVAASFLIAITPCIAYLEARKMGSFLNDCFEMQVAFETLTDKKFSPYPFNRVKKCMVLLSIVISVASAVTGMETVDSYEKNFKMGHAASIKTVMFCTSFGCGSFLMTAAILWMTLNGALIHFMDNIAAEIEVCHWRKHTLNNYFILWLGVRRLCYKLGSVLGWTFAYLLGLMFLLALPSIFLGLHSVSEGQYLATIPCLSSIFYITAFLEYPHGTIQEVGVEFENRLTKLLLSKKASGKEDELKAFIGNLAGYSVNIPLAGFFAMDRSVNVSMYSTLITYAVIILQLKWDNKGKF